MYAIKGELAIDDLKPLKQFRFMLTAHEWKEVPAWLAKATTSKFKTLGGAIPITACDDDAEDGIVPFSKASSTSKAAASPISLASKDPAVLGPKAAKEAKAKAAIDAKNDHLLSMFLGKRKRAVD